MAAVQTPASLPSIYARNAKALFSSGFEPIPIAPHSKYPSQYSGIAMKDYHLFKTGEIMWWPMKGWTSFTHEDIGRHVPVWSRMPGNAGIGVRHSSAFIGFDFDVSDNPDLQSEIIDLFDEQSGTIVRRKGSKGFCQYFRANGDIDSGSIKLDGQNAVDILACGKQSVLPPSIHPGTKRPYEWLPDSVALCDVELHDLPLLTPALLEQVIEIMGRYGRVAYGGGGGGGENRGGIGTFDGWYYDPWDRAAMTQLDDWVPTLGLYGCTAISGGYIAVPTWRPSGTGRPDGQRKRSLKITDKRGIRDQSTGEFYTPLKLVATVLDVDNDKAWDWLCDKIGYERLEPWAPKPRTRSSGLKAHKDKNGESDVDPDQVLDEKKFIERQIKENLGNQRFLEEQQEYQNLEEGRLAVDKAAGVFFEDKVSEAQQYRDTVGPAQAQISSLSYKLKMLHNTYAEELSDYLIWARECKEKDRDNERELAAAELQDAESEVTGPANYDRVSSLLNETYNYEAEFRVLRLNRLHDLLKRRVGIRAMCAEYQAALNSEKKALENAPPVYLLIAPAGVGKTYAVAKHIVRHPERHIIVSQPRNDLNEEFREIVKGYDTSGHTDVQLVRGPLADDYSHENLVKPQNERNKMCLMDVQAAAIQGSGGRLDKLCQQQLPLLNKEGKPVRDENGKPIIEQTQCEYFGQCRFQEQCRSIPTATKLATTHSRLASSQINWIKEESGESCDALIFDENILPAFINGSDDLGNAASSREIDLAAMIPPALHVFASADKAQIEQMHDEDGNQVDAERVRLIEKQRTRNKQYNAAKSVIDMLTAVVKQQFELRPLRIEAEIDAECEFKVSHNYSRSEDARESLRKNKTPDAPLYWGKRQPKENLIDLGKIMGAGWSGDDEPPVVTWDRPDHFSKGVGPKIVEDARLSGIRTLEFEQAAAYFYSASAALNSYIKPNIPGEDASARSEQIRQQASLCRNIARILREIKEIVVSDVEKPGRVVAVSSSEKGGSGIALVHRSMNKLRPEYRGTAILLINAFPEPTDALEEIFQFRVYSIAKEHPARFLRSPAGCKYREKGQIYYKINRRIEILGRIKVRIDDKVTTLLLTNAPSSGRALGLKYLSEEIEKFEKAVDKGNWHQVIDPIDLDGNPRRPRKTEANNRGKFLYPIEDEVNRKRSCSEGHSPAKVVVAANKQMLSWVKSSRGQFPDQPIDFMSFGRTSGTNKYENHDSLIMIGYDNPGDGGFAGLVGAIYGEFISDRRKWCEHNATIRDRFGIKRPLGKLYHYANEPMRALEEFKIISTVGQGTARLRPLTERNYKRLVIVAVRGRPHFIPSKVLDWGDLWKAIAHHAKNEKLQNLLETGGLSTYFSHTQILQPGAFDTQETLKRYMNAMVYPELQIAGNSTVTAYKYLYTPRVRSSAIFCVSYREKASGTRWSDFLFAAPSYSDAVEGLQSTLENAGIQIEIKGKNIADIFATTAAVPSGKRALATQFNLTTSEADRIAREMKAGIIPGTHRAIVIRKMTGNNLQVRGSTVYLSRNLSAEIWAIKNAAFDPSTDVIDIPELI